MFETGCPIGCKYCMATMVRSRAAQWAAGNRIGVNRSCSFINRLPGETALRDWVNPGMFAGDVLGFQGITDPLLPIFQEDLSWLISTVASSRIRKLMLATKFPRHNALAGLASLREKALLVVSITGLDSLEKITSRKRIELAAAAQGMGIPTIAAAHPWIEGVSDPEIFQQISEAGVRQVVVKGFRYDPCFETWAPSNIPAAALSVYREAGNNETLLGSPKQLAIEAGLELVDLKSIAQAPNGIRGVTTEEAAESVRQMRQLGVVVSSSSPEKVWKEVQTRRIQGGLYFRGGRDVL